MRKTLLLCLLALTSATTGMTQTPAPAAEKEILIVDFFTRARTIPAPYTEVLRSYVLEAFSQRGRHRVFDAATMPELGNRLPGTGFVTPETAPAVTSEFLEFRAPEAASTGARYLVCGTMIDYKFEHAEILSTDSKKPPRQGFKATFRVVLSAVDLQLGERMPDEAYTLTATAPVAEDADRAALARIRGQIEYYIDRNFKFETRILELCRPDKKDRFRELYIHSGTSMGVKTGDLFMVFEEVPIGGVMTRQKVGRLRVNDVENPEVARCKVTKGDEEIADAFLKGRGLICVSDGKEFGF